MKYESLGGNTQICVSRAHTFGTDALLLARFAAPKRGDRVCDLGPGCGIIPVLMTMEFSPAEIFGVDIQEEAVELLRNTVKKNGLENIVPIKADIKTLWEGYPAAAFDLVTCNPPYKAAGTGLESETRAQKIARHEVLCDINDVCAAAAKLLRFRGRLCLCNRPERLGDVITAMKVNGIEPKLLQFISKTPSDPPWLFLAEGRRGGKPFMKILPQTSTHHN
jgi:tRNA1(Val) A37 N6-methylase TrmN6